MRIFTDENIPSMTVRELRAMDFDVLDLRGTEDEGATDEWIWATAQMEKRLLITTDKGFTHHRNELHYGILIVCLHQPNRHRIHKRVMNAINQFAEDDWKNLLVVMRDTTQSIWKVKINKSDS